MLSILKKKHVLFPFRYYNVNCWELRKQNNSVKFADKHFDTFDLKVYFD